jgi:hypothetical protein
MIRLGCGVAGVLAIVAGWGIAPARAQEESPVQATVLAPSSPPVSFDEVQKTPAELRVPVPAGANSQRILASPADKNGMVALLHFYGMKNVAFVEVFTQYGSAAPVRRNRIRLNAADAARPEGSTVQMWRLEPRRGRGWLMDIAGSAYHVVLTFPGGLAGKAFQQEFQGSDERTFTFDDTDSRGIRVVKASIGAEDHKFWVWNGVAFIPRKPN